MAESITGGYFVYEEKDGDALITNYSGEDTIYIASGEVDGYYFDDEDLILKIGDGSIRLQYMKGRNVTIMTSDSVTTSQVYGTDYSAQDVIKNLVKAWSQTLLTDTAKLDESIKLCSHFDGIQDAINHMIADCKAAGNANTFLRKYCGIILDNLDTGAITGWDAGGSSVKTAAGVVPETSTVRHIKNYAKASFVRDGVTINIAEKLSSLTADGKKVLDGLYSWWAEEALKLVEESYGVEMAGNKINIALTPSATYRALTTGNDVSINMQGVTFNDADDYQGNGIDRSIAHEFTHVAQNLFMGYFPQFLMEGLADLTCGIDDKRRSYINSLAGNSDSLASYLDLDTAGTGSAFHYAAGYMFYRYLARQASSNYDSLKAHAWEDNAKLSGTSKADFLTGNGSNQTLSAGKGNDTITAYGDSAQIYGGAGHDYILTKGESLSIDGGAGNDTIDSHGDNSTCAVGMGDDSIYNDGADVTISGGDGYDSIDNYGDNVSIDAGAGDDYINNYSGAVSVDASNGDDDILNLSDNSLLEGGDDNDFIQNGVYLNHAELGNANGGSNVTINGGSGDDYLLNRAGQFITFDGGSGNDNIVNDGGVNVTINAGNDDDIIVNNGGINVTIDAGAGNDTINNQADTADNVLISAGADNDLIRNWCSNLTIDGGEGDDTITSSGENILIFYRAGDGNDYIAGFNETSTLRIGDGSSTYSTLESGSDILIAVGDGTITLSGAASLETLHIDGKIQKALVVDNSMNAKITLGSDIGIVDATTRTKAIKLVGNALDNTILGGSGKDTLYGANGNDYLVGNAGNDRIYGQDGNDTLWGGAGNDTLKGGDGSDVFVYSAGNDLIYDYAEGDVISLGAAISKSSFSGNNAILTIGSNKLTIKNGKGKELSLIESNGTTRTIIGGASLLSDSSAAKVTLKSTYEVADASTRTSAIRLVGNSLDNTILGGSGKDTLYGSAGADYLAGGAGSDRIYGQDGNDTLWGGAGNDTLKGGDGSDTYLYNSGDGKDVIYGFDDTDMLQITETFMASLNAVGNIVFKVGSTASAITLKDFTAETFNINGDTYAISGKKLVKQ